MFIFLQAVVSTPDGHLQKNHMSEYLGVCRSAQEIPANIVTPTRTASAQETPQAAAKLIRTVGPDGQPRVLLTVPKGGCYISQENFEKLMATSKNLVGGQSGPILMASGDGNQPGMKTVSFAVKPAVSGSPLTSSPKQNSNISVAQMGAAQTSGSGGQTPTVIPLPDGKFIQRDRNGDLSLMLRNKTTGVLMNLGRLSSEVLEKANISKLLSGDLSIQQFQTSYSGTDGCQVGSSGQPATLDPASLLVSPPRENQQQNSSNVQLFSPRNLLPANKSVTQPIIVSTPSIKLTTPAKPICSVAPVLQQSVLSQASSSMAPSHTAYTILSGQQSGTANSQALNGSTVLIQSPPVLVLGTNQVGTVGQQV